MRDDPENASKLIGKSVTVVGMQKFTYVMRRPQWTFVHDDSFILATIERDAGDDHPEEPPDDKMFINSNFLPNGRYSKQESRRTMINSVSSASAASHAVAPRNAAQAKPHPASSSEPKDSVQLSPKAQAQASGDVDHDGDSH
jgi:hypothetical protein